MMPFVDSCVALSQEHYTLSDYLNDASGFHTLRMVAVQPSPESSALNTNPAHQGLEALKSLQEQARTRGSGGLPNGIVAYCDLGDAATIQSLLDCVDVQNLRGVHQELKFIAGLTNEKANALVASWSESVALIAIAKWSIDITASVTSSNILKACANTYSDVDLVFNVVVDANQEIQDLEQWVSLLSALANRENIYLKLSCTNMGLHCSKLSKSTQPSTLFATFLSQAIHVIGAERIMFGSGLNASVNSEKFRLQWDEFVGAASELTARQRDRVFRTNAMSVYKL